MLDANADLLWLPEESRRAVVVVVFPQQAGEVVAPSASAFRGVSVFCFCKAGQTWLGYASRMWIAVGDHKCIFCPRSQNPRLIWVGWTWKIIPFHTFHWCSKPLCPGWPWTSRDPEAATVPGPHHPHFLPKIQHIPNSVGWRSPVELLCYQQLYYCDLHLLSGL